MRLTGLIHAVEAHAEGEPARVIVGGVVDVPGATMFEKKLYLERERDSLRMLLMQEPLTELILEAPAGLVRVRAECRDGRVRRVTFQNLPAYAAHLDAQV